MASQFPLPGAGRSAVAARAPGAGVAHWAGAPSAALDADGGWVVAYRVREGVPPEGRAETPGSKHWWIDVLEAGDPAGLGTAEPRTVFPGDDRTAVKDPVVRRVPGGWEAWICCHPLDEPGEEDRMTTAYATSEDGLAWRWHGTVLTPRPGSWDARGARLTAVLADGRAAYDGRATREENWSERTGLARRTAAGFEGLGGSPVSNARYLDVVRLPDGRFRLYYEWPLPDGSHELRTELVG